MLSQQNHDDDGALLINQTSYYVRVIEIWD